MTFYLNGYSRLKGEPFLIDKDDFTFTGNYPAYIIILNQNDEYVEEYRRTSSREIKSEALMNRR